MALLGTTSNLVSGTLTLTLPSTANFWFIQNQDTAPLKITFLGAGSGYLTSLILVEATSTGDAGGYIDSSNLPYFDTTGFTLTSTVSTAQFGSGYSIRQPSGPNTLPAYNV